MYILYIISLRTKMFLANIASFVQSLLLLNANQTLNLNLMPAFAFALINKDVGADFLFKKCIYNCLWYNLRRRRTENWVAC